MNSIKRCHNYRTGTHDLAIRISTEENVHAASVRKPKKIGDTSLDARPRCRLPLSRLVAKSKKRDANLVSPCRLLNSNRKRNPAPLTRHTGINQPAFTIPNFSQTNQELPQSNLQRTKLNQVDKNLQRPPVTQVAATVNVRSKRLDLRA
jgi:hypothetical protein